MKPLWTKPFIVLTASTFFLFSGFYMLLPSMPLFITELGGNESQVGIIVGLFMLSSVALRPFIGASVDKHGRKPFITFGLLSFAVALYAHSWATGLVFLALIRLLHGLSWAVSTTAISTAVTDQIPHERLGEGMSWYGLASTLAMAIGPLIAVSVLVNYSYTGVFTLGATLAVISLLATFFVPLPFQRHTITGPTVMFERSLLPVSVIVFFFAVVYAGIVTFIPLFSQSIGVNSGLFFTVYAVSLAVVRFISGRIADNYGEATVIFPGLGIMILAVLILSLTKGLSGIVVGAVLFGIGFGAAQPILQATMVRTVRSDQKGIANATFITAFDLGIGLGSIGLGWIPNWKDFPALFLATAISGAIALFLYFISHRRMKVKDEATMKSDP